MNSLVAVYGTLKKGGRFHNNFLLGCPYITSFWSEPDSFSMFSVEGRYPCLVEGGDKPTRVFFEVYEVSEDTLKRLDYLEGVADGLYKRLLMFPEYGDKAQKMFTYVAGPQLVKEMKDYPQVLSGNWDVNQK